MEVLEGLINTGVRRAAALVSFDILEHAEATEVADDVKTFSIIKVSEVLTEWSYRRADGDVIRLLNAEGRESLSYVQLDTIADRLSHWMIERFNRCCQLYACEGELAAAVRNHILRPFGRRITDWAYHARRTRRIHELSEERRKTAEVREKRRMLSWSQPDHTPIIAEIRDFLQSLDDDDEGIGPAAAAAAAAAAPVAAPADAPAAEDGDVEGGDESNAGRPDEAFEAGDEQGEGGVNAEDGDGQEEIVAGVGGVIVEDGDGVEGEVEGGEVN